MMQRKPRIKSKPPGWLTVGELVGETGITKATVHHYVRMGLLPRPLKKNKQMAYYAPECTGRIALIKELQEKRFLPLNVIRKVLTSSAGTELRSIDHMILEDFNSDKVYSREELLGRYHISARIFSQLVRAGVVHTSSEEMAYSEEDAQLLSIISKMREAGLSERLGFSIQHLRLYTESCDDLIEKEFRLFNKRVLGKLTPQQIAQLARSAIYPSSQLLALLHKKRLIERLKRMEPSA
ncbi:MAG: MerR family transcriptional regulator [Deltaproteobacteria bacterium]|nr:MerR family transcriptional regulator [Deltaproteobacteria bacterium]